MESSPFSDLLGQFADGAKWRIFSGRGREELARRITADLGELDPRRRQAIVMCLFALVAGDMQPGELAGFLAERSMDSDEDVEALIAWLRENFDPR